jgi:hypothetical protein
MKNLQTNDSKLVELDLNEMTQTNGGGLIVFAFLAGMALAYYECKVK